MAFTCLRPISQLRTAQWLLSNSPHPKALQRLLLPREAPAFHEPSWETGSQGLWGCEDKGYRGCTMQKTRLRCRKQLNTYRWCKKQVKPSGTAELLQAPHARRVRLTVLCFLRAATTLGTRQRFAATEESSLCRTPRTGCEEPLS